jgi:CBS domain containing-hemolysin-like protein
MGGTALPLEEAQLVAAALVALLLCGLFALLRSALLHSVPDRVLERARSEEERRRLRPLLMDRLDSLVASARICEITCQLSFLVLVLGRVAGTTLTWAAMGISLFLAIPLLLVVREVLPSAMRGERADTFLCWILPAFDRLQRPLAALVFGLDALRRTTMRLFRIPERPAAARRIVEGLRTVIEDSEREGDLHETEREIIENVVQFHDVDVAQVMTPRTALFAVEVTQGVQGVLEAMAESGHSRIPVYEQSLDQIIGVAYAHEILRLAATRASTNADLRSLLRPVRFVPETKPVSELLADFRRERRKIAVVLDEYGGTAGVVTLGDIVHELVGGMRDENGETAPAPVKRLAPDLVEVRGTAHVTEVNEEVGIDLPEEEDFETVAGFVLAELGRFPRRGESFRWREVEFQVTDSTDRRIHLLRLRVAPREKSS